MKKPDDGILISTTEFYEFCIRPLKNQTSSWSLSVSDLILVQISNCNITSMDLFQLDNDVKSQITVMQLSTVQQLRILYSFSAQ